MSLLFRYLRTELKGRLCISDDRHNACEVAVAAKYTSLELRVIDRLRPRMELYLPCRES
jgi:hypothetical protein